ncbi:C25 family cysteine peptidase [Granulicella sibirica]|uniref:Gingipain domain-containing protein n=1 Tax=Granulicella sibirica TaxID=2479048 RepID=A0A4Q0T3T7_9BACT|nr:C25 family cysteine peptidase [Granulicella sibirica]RXH58283.1 hypothetical protein GRAN_1593 [Granulicella sibirica]
MTSNAFPMPLCVRAATSRVRPPLTDADVPHLPPDLPNADKRKKSGKILGTDSSVPNPQDLTMAGWGIIFATNPQAELIKAQLQPLIDLRRSQVQSADLFRIFEGPQNGVTPNLTAEAWAYSRGVTLNAPVHPRGKVPYYLLLVGSPQDISFEFQNKLKMQWAVGRLYFNDIADYGRYAASIVQYESESFTPAQAKKAACWMTRNPKDQPTDLLSSTLKQAFDNPDPGEALGASRSFPVDYYVSAQATKPQLQKLLSGGPQSPAILFTGSHGADYWGAVPEIQRRMQGSLITQEWSDGAALDSSNSFSADDVPATANLQGAMVFLFACYSGGCPAFDSYTRNEDGSLVRIADEDMISRLPQTLLAKGALAVLGHVDIAHCDSFLTTDDTPQTQVIASPLEYLMDGMRVGRAADSLTSVWTSLSASAGSAKPPTGTTAAAAQKRAAYARLVVSRDDLKNFILLGDPAARLKVEKFA